MKISVLIPVFNVEKFVGEAVRSILDDRLNLEVIVIDDGSSDKTYEVLVSQFDTFEQVRIFRNHTNLGIVNTLNRAFEHSTGDFIARMDGDDVSLSGRLKLQMDYLLSNPDIHLVGVSNSFFFDDVVFQENIYPCSHDEIVRRLKWNNAFSHNWMATRQLYETLQGYNNMAPAEDYDFVCRAVISGFRVANLSDVLMKIRFRFGNTDSTAAYPQYLFTRSVAAAFSRGLQTGLYAPATPAIRPIFSRLYNLAHMVRRFGSRKGGIIKLLCMATSFVFHPTSFLYFLRLKMLLK